MGTLVRILIWLTAAVLVYLASAPPNDAALAQRVAQEVARGPGITLDLDRVAPFGWDRVCTFPPYTERGGAQSTLGHPWLYRWSSDMSLHEHLTYLVFMDGYFVAGAAELLRSDGDFAQIGSACVERADAVFGVAEKPPGWPDWPDGRQVYHVRLER